MIKFSIKARVTLDGYTDGGFSSFPPSLEGNSGIVE
jgi:hypothetical protein